MLNDGQGLSHLQDAHSAAQARFAATAKAMKLVRYTSGQMAGLLKLADTVTPEDVVAAAGKIVGQGTPATAMAATLAAMPTEPGEALAGWVAQRAAALDQLNQQLSAAHEAARHEMATGALRELVGHQVQGHQEAAMQQEAGPGGPPLDGASPAPPGGPLGASAPPPPPDGAV